jgi:hypothetical protein
LLLKTWPMPSTKPTPRAPLIPPGRFSSLTICRMVSMAWVTDGSVKAILPLNSWSYLSAPAWSR